MEENNNLNEELIKRLENAAKEGVKEGIKEYGLSSNKSTAKARILELLIKGVLVIVLCFSFSSFIQGLNPFTALQNMFSLESDVADHDMTLKNNGLFGYTVADFEEVILGDSTNLKKLEVYSQEVSQMVQFTSTGLGKLKIFTKSKYYTYHGTAIYTVDLGLLTKESITLDSENLTVILTIPHTEMTTLDIPQDKMEIGDTQKGVLAFGDLSMNDEQSKEIMATARENMTQTLLEDNIQEKADKIAKVTVWELYQPLITKAAPGYSLKVEFKELVTE